MAATHALITAVCARRRPRRAARATSTAARTGSSTRCSPAGACATTSSTRPTSTRVAAAVRDDTRLIWVETPTNPLLNVVDIEGVVARRRNALVAVDNTFATPVNQRPLELGADFVVHSTTKYLGGHSDTVGGAVVVARRRACRAAPLRAERDRRGARARSTASSSTAGCARCTCGWRAHAESAEAVVAFLRRGRGRHRRALAGLQRHGELPPPRRRSAIAEATELFTLAESLGGVESLIEVPAGDDAPVRRGLRRRRAGGPRAAVVRRRGAGGPRRDLRARVRPGRPRGAQRSAAGQAMR